MYPTTKDQLMQMARESTLVQGAVTFVLIGTCCAIWLKGGVPDPVLITLTGSVMGFWFGQKTGQQTRSVIENTVQPLVNSLQAAQTQPKGGDQNAR